MNKNLIVVGISALSLNAYAFGLTPLGNPPTNITQNVTVNNGANGNTASDKTPDIPTQPIAQPAWCNEPNLTYIEQAICTNPVLSGLDNQMSQVYETQRTDGQREWLIERDTCGTDVNCLIEKYETRLKQMVMSDDTQVSAMSTQSQSNAPWWCGNALNTVETIICQNADLWELDNELNRVWSTIKSKGTLKKQKACIVTS